MTEIQKEESSVDVWRMAVKGYLRGVAQVMFQGNAGAGWIILIAIFWGAYENNQWQVAWGAVVGCLVANAVACILGEKPSELKYGLSGFNGLLVGCAIPTFLSNTPLMWVALIVCSASTVWVRRGLNNVMARWKINSMTFPFVMMTWIFLFASYFMSGLQGSGLSQPELDIHYHFSLDTSVQSLLIYWLKGISQVFLVDSWFTGALILMALLSCNTWAAIWAMIGSALSLAVAMLFHADAVNISHGLFSFSPVLTAIALGCTFYKPNYKTALWALAGVVVTVFVQAAMDAMLMPYGLPTLTAPFCITTWLFLLPLYKMDAKEPVDHTEWHHRLVEIEEEVTEELKKK